MLLTIAAVVLVTAVSAAPASGQDDLSPEERLAERHAPIVMIKAQDGPCDTNGEPFEPAPVEIVLDNPEIFLRQVGNGDPVAVRGPTSADLYDLREGWYLEFPGDALDPGCVFEQDFERFYDGTSVVYAHIAREADHPDVLALQYWFFWYHNPAKNDHEGDWEFVQLLFDARTVEEALAGTPTEVGYAQHLGGERSAWDDDKLEREGQRPVVYAARGSHASYFDQALYLGRSGREGFGCDNTDGPSERLDPQITLLPDRVTDPDDPMAWLAFRGRWGQRERGFFNGPTGPFAKPRWTEPVSWHERLRDSSVVIPSGDRQGDAVITTFCGAVEFGSSLLINANRSPVAALSTVLLLAVGAAILARRTRWSPVRTKPLQSDRAVGQILRASLHTWRDRPQLLIWVGLVYIPIAIASTLVYLAVSAIPLVDDVQELAGARSGVGLLAGVLVGGIASLLAFVYVSCVVARIVDDRCEDPRGIRASVLPIADLGRLLASVARATIIVVALLVSIVGTPWGIRQLVRYQLVPQAVALEGLSGPNALRRSSELTRGRWWWTFAVVSVLQLTMTAAGLALALMILLVFTSIPLWLFNVLSSAVYVVLAPVGGAAMAYVYGTLDAAGDPSDDDRVDRLEVTPA